MSFQDIQTAYDKHIAHTYARIPVDVQSGQGTLCKDGDGKEYIDFSSGIGVNSLGFTNNSWLQAVKDQLDKLAHMSNLYYTEPQAKLAEQLCHRTQMQRVFFSNSGAEANEGAIKAARKYGSDKYGPRRHEIITLQNSFHGRTIATLAATGQDVFHKAFGPFPSGFVYAEANNIPELRKRITANTCAIMIECIQGEGGVMPLKDAYMAEIQDICAENDILLVVDEVQTGMGRTGKLLCSEHFGLKPDIVTLAKGLGGGLPIGAVLFGEKTMDTLGKGDHGSTFGGNPVVCAGARVVLESMDQAFLDQVTQMGDYLCKRLQEIPEIVSVSGRGLMLGAELKDGLVSGDIAAACAKNGLIVLTAKHKLRFLPPLTIDKDTIDKGISILAKTIQQVKGE